MLSCGQAGPLCGHLVTYGSVHAFLADHRHQLGPDEMFACVPVGAGPSVAAGRGDGDPDGASALEELSSGRALCQNIASKLAAGLTIDDDEVHPSVLTYGRNRLRESPRRERIFDAVRDG